MNQRIKGLLEQATEFHDYWYKGEGRCIVNYEKFAELIVRECVGRVRYCIQNDLDYIAEDIEQHFGVEK